MKICEISGPDENTKITNILHEYFEFSDDYRISDDGIVDVFGDIRLKKNTETFPIKFGTTYTFDCCGNNLKSLDGAPQKTIGSFLCSGNYLNSLIGGPKIVHGDYLCGNNQLTSLIGAPESVGNNFDCNQNNLETLEGLPKTIKAVFKFSYKTDLPLLRILLVSNLIGIMLYDEIGHYNVDYMEAAAIIENHLHQGRGGIMACAAELIKAGYTGNARL